MLKVKNNLVPSVMGKLAVVMPELEEQIVSGEMYLRLGLHPVQLTHISILKRVSYSCIC